MLPLSHSRIETCGFNALPATHTLLYDGWLIRLAGGGPKRANSVNVLGASSMDFARKLRHCEALFAAQGIVLTLRITDHAGNTELDGFLAGQGLARLDETIVMSCDLARLPDGDTLHYRELEREAWFAQMLRLDQAGEARKRKHIELLKNLALPAIYGGVEEDGQCAAIGLAVLDDEHVGLFDVNTDQAMRRRGLARQLMRTMLGEAKVRGARLAYLQVVASNLPAISLYQSLGFTPCYRYWYRSLP